MLGLSLPRVIGHRGAAGHAPENTPASFRKAAQLGCRMVEFDVRLTRDEVPVVFHDDRLERVTNGRGRVRDHRLSDLAGLDAGGGERIPALAETISLCLDLGVAVNIEIKPDRGNERRTAILALEIAGRLWPSDRPPPLVSSFSGPALAAAREVAPSWPRGLLVDKVPGDWLRRARALDCRAVHACQDRLESVQVAAIRAQGLAVAAYTVNDPARARRLWGQGVDALFSDFPDRLMEPLSLSS